MRSIPIKAAEHGEDLGWDAAAGAGRRAVAAHKRHRKFVDVMEGRGFAPVSALSDEPPVVVAGAEDAVTVDVGGEVVEEAARYAEREL